MFCVRMYAGPTLSWALLPRPGAWKPLEPTELFLVWEYSVTSNPPVPYSPHCLQVPRWISSPLAGMHEALGRGCRRPPHCLLCPRLSDCRITLAPNWPIDCRILDATSVAGSFNVVLPFGPSPPDALSDGPTRSTLVPVTIRSLPSTQALRLFWTLRPWTNRSVSHLLLRPTRQAGLRRRALRSDLPSVQCPHTLRTTRATSAR